MYLNNKSKLIIIISILAAEPLRSNVIALNI